jgi:hypothetical protein
VRWLPALLGLGLSLGLFHPAAAHSSRQSGADTRWLVAYTSPSGTPLQADERLVPALDVLAPLDEGRPLLDALAQGRVLVLFAADTLDEGYAFYDDLLRLIAIDPGLQAIDPRALAALVAREAAQAQRDLDGSARTDAIVRGDVEACIRDELAATRAELEVWHRLVGPGGLGAAQHPYEVRLNDALAESLAAPAQFAQQVRRQALGSCRD